MPGDKKHHGWFKSRRGVAKGPRIAGVVGSRTGAAHPRRRFPTGAALGDVYRDVSLFADVPDRAGATYRKDVVVGIARAVIQGSPRVSAKLTPQQDVAVSRREVSIVLSSGAGCGKTHVLTERYLSHLHEGAEVGQIVAITFTDRAARQMRDRIRRAVTHELRTYSSEEELDRWSRHLRALETAQISTIHAFCGTLLRQHAVAAGIDPLFDVLDEVMAANLRAEAYAGGAPGIVDRGWSRRRR